VNAGKLKFNPWAQKGPRDVEAPVRPQTVETSTGVTLGTNRGAAEKDVEREAPAPRVDIQVKPYGGIIVEGATTPTEGMSLFLDWCMRRPASVEPTLTDAAVLMIELETVPSNGFYIRRPDGWTLCVPHAQNRDQALVQIVQAVLALSANPLFATSLKNAGISAYRL
jgi:hypothetical protein